jgi:PadR family transcriptional regulator, regulatory protein PadR
MEILSRSEEIILLAIWHLQRDAYGVRILEILRSITGTDWTIGAIYAPLHRLEKKGFVETRKGDPLPERGGRSRVYYRVTRHGKEAMAESKRIHDSLWKNAPDLNTEESA